MCSKKECLLKRKTIMKNTNVDTALKYLEQCEKCCYRKEQMKEKHELETYAESRKQWVTAYWNEREKC